MPRQKNVVGYLYYFYIISTEMSFHFFTCGALGRVKDARKCLHVAVSLGPPQMQLAIELVVFNDWIFFRDRSLQSHHSTPRPFLLLAPLARSRSELLHLCTNILEKIR